MEKTCKYCSFEEGLARKASIERSNGQTAICEIFFEGLNDYSFVVRVVDKDLKPISRISTKINYCHMCGRKLTE